MQSSSKCHGSVCSGATYFTNREKESLAKLSRNAPIQFHPDGYYYAGSRGTPIPGHDVSVGAAILRVALFRRVSFLQLSFFLFRESASHALRM
jgi:hypothetical protein